MGEAVGVGAAGGIDTLTVTVGVDAGWCGVPCPCPWPCDPPGAGGGSGLGDEVGWGVGRGVAVCVGSAVGRGVVGGVAGVVPVTVVAYATSATFAEVPPVVSGGPARAAVVAPAPDGVAAGS
ncbi:hypothetical protein, partial [Microbispora sp. ATCC PTA-5024]|uniref:hypothetical protein n=1 Tax=Microbispora sp. ATCC PTA-5024 TaxID=316330 RepID=UPI001E362E1B